MDPLGGTTNFSNTDSRIEIYDFGEYLVTTSFKCHMKLGNGPVPKSKSLYVLRLKPDPGEVQDPSRVSTDSKIKIDPNSTPLLMAVWTGDVQKSKLLLEENPKSIHDRDRKAGTPLICLAAQWSDLLPMMELLIQYGADPNDVSTEGSITPIGAASALGIVENVRFLYEKGASIEGRDESHPLFVASHYGHFEVVKFLVEKGADVNRISKKDGNSPLGQACLRGHKNIVSYLISKGADLGPSPSKLSPLILAAEGGYFDVIDMLVKNKADVNYQGKDGITAIFLSVRNNKKDIVKFLCSNGANPNVSIEAKNTRPLHVASQKGYTDIVNILLENKAEPDVELESGLTPLYLAVNKGYFNIVKLLLNASADPHYDCSGTTPIELAMKKKKENIYDLLKEKRPNTPRRKTLNSGSIKLRSLIKDSPK